MFTKYFLCLLLVGQSLLFVSAKCNSKQAIDGDLSRVVCVCDSSACDSLEFEWPKQQGQVYLVESSNAGSRFEFSDITDASTDRTTKTKATVNVNLNERFQSILGWGGAFTDAAALNIHNLSTELGDKLIESYFGSNGLQYNIGRVPLGGSDFSTRPYTYDDSTSNDYELKSWSLEDEDIKHKIPVIKSAMEHTKKAGTNLKLFSSPWSAPAWMKTNNKLVRGSLKDQNEVYEAYTQYLMKFFDAYKSHGIEFWGATIQNEPMSPKVVGPIYFFNSMEYTSEQMIKFIVKYLGPALRARGLTRENFKLIVGDDSLGFIDRQAIAVMGNVEVQQYVSGFAFHWYTSGLLAPYDSITTIYETMKDHIEFVMMSEACTGSVPFSKGVKLGDWGRAEQYAADIIEDINRQTGSWIDWNLALNLEGGPNWSKNVVDAPIIVNGEKNEFYKQPMYYALAHFSRLFRPGSIRIGTSVHEDGIHLFRSDILATTVHNEETGHLIVNVLNQGKGKRTIELKIQDTNAIGGEAKTKSIVVSEKSISSIVIKL